MEIEKEASLSSNVVATFWYKIQKKCRFRTKRSIKATGDGSRTINYTRTCVVIGVFTLVLLSVCILSFSIIGGLLYKTEHTMKTYYLPSSCQVKDISYRLIWCKERLKERFRCYQINWHVTYSLLQNLTEYSNDLFNATIQSTYARHYRYITDAINAAQEFQVRTQTYIFIRGI
ncbi:unnamed protein product [Adineta ricciae]|uniref:Uncharacterized protein n=1 Tax=Adineta ricciae TaxID=249248 RepID=A0A815WP99_ADIRI|nr:unnamed protein product [Adineta ricciae]